MNLILKKLFKMSKGKKETKAYIIVKSKKGDPQIKSNDFDYKKDKFKLLDKCDTIKEGLKIIKNLKNK